MHYEYNSKKEKATAKKEKNKPAITQWERELYQVWSSKIEKNIA